MRNCQDKPKCMTMAARNIRPAVIKIHFTGASLASYPRTLGWGIPCGFAERLMAISKSELHSGIVLREEGGGFQTGQEVTNPNPADSDRSGEIQPA